MTIPSSGTSQGGRDNFDAGSLSWVMGEIREALTRSKTALFEAVAQDEETQLTALRHAKSYLHQAHGALQIVDIEGVALITETAEDLLERLEAGQIKLNPEMARAVESAYQALVEYLEELLSGAPHQPVRLFPYYKTLLEVRGAERIHPADLFFPNLAIRPQLPPHEDGYTGGRVDYLHLRQRFEKALLPFLKKPDAEVDIDDAALMRDIIHDIERLQENPQSQVFWWVMHAFADAVAAGQVHNEVYVKQLFARINLQIRRLSEGSFSIAERLLRDALFFIAQVETPSPMARQVRGAYQLDGLVPADYDKKRYGQIDIESLIKAKERLTHAKSMWNRIAAGDVSVADTFEHEMKALAEAGSKLESPPLSKLLRELNAIAKHAAHSAPGEGLSLEMATSLLFIENALNNINRLSENFADRADAMTARLLAIVSGEQPAESAEWLDDMSREAQQRQTMTALASEMQASLRQVEKMLDEYFNNPEERATLGQIEQILHQIGGAMAVLDQDDAMRAIQHTQAAVKSFASAESGVTPDTALFQQVAQNVGALSFFIETVQLQTDGAKKRFSFDDKLGIFHDNFLEKPESGTSLEVVVAPISASEQAEFHVNARSSLDLPTVEAELAYHQQQTAELAKSLTAEPDNAELHEQLKESLEKIRMDATLVDNPAANERAQAAIDMLEHPDFVPSKDALADIVSTVSAPVQAPVARIIPAAPSPVTDEAVDAELLEIFLLEAEEVLGCVNQTLPMSRREPYNQEHLTTLRRSFHTLKGSGRMVGLNVFGEAAWSIEQILNLWLSDARGGTPDLYALLDKSATLLSAWVEDLQTQGASNRTADALVRAAERLKADGIFFFEEVSNAPQEEVIAEQPAPAEPFAAPVAEAPLPQIALPEEIHASLDEEELPPLAIAEAVTPVAPQAEEPAAAEEMMPMMEAIVPAPVEPVVMEEPIAEQSTPQAEEHIEAIALPEEPHPEEARTPHAKLTTTDKRKAKRKARTDAKKGAHAHDSDGAGLEENTSPPVIEDIHSSADHIETEPSQVYPFRGETEPAEPDGSAGTGIMAETAVAEHPGPLSETTEFDHAETAPVPVAAEHTEEIAAVADDVSAEDVPTIPVEPIDASGQEDAAGVPDMAAEAGIPVVAERNAAEPDLVPVAQVIEFPSMQTSIVDEGNDEGIKRVGDLEISVPLYNIYLAETGELVHLLSQDFAEWRNEPERAVNIYAVHAAHSLSGSSATVGFKPLQEVAHALEMVLQYLARNKPVKLKAGEYDTLGRTVEVMDSMLQKFAAGEMPARELEQVQILTRLLQEIEARSKAGPEAPAAASAPGEAHPADDAASADQKIIFSERRVAAPKQEAPKSAAPIFTNENEVAIDPTLVIKDELDPDLLPVFIEEGRDMLPQIGQSLRAWQQKPSDAALPQSLLRSLHTIKGSARMAGAMRLGQHMHDTETRIQNVMRAGNPSAQTFDDLLARLDHGLYLFERLQNPDAASQPEVAFVGAEQTKPATTAEGKPGDKEMVVVPSLMPAQTGRFAAPAWTGAKPATPTHTPLVRVRADILDRLVNQAGEVSISRSKLETEVGTLRQSLSEMTENVSRLRAQLRELEIQAETQITSRMALSGDREFDPLEFDRFTRLQELTRMLAESVNDVASVQQNLTRTVDSAATDLLMQARLTRDLQQDLMRVRMVQFASISERLYRVTRQASKEVDKRVNLDIRGSSVEIDRSVLEKMVGPFEHLLRNAIVHGIEARQERRDVGKDETGELLVEIRQEGNEVVIQFSDDGRGLNLQNILSKGKKLGLVTDDQELTEAEITELIFHPGFSTADQVTELAGRGVGMDVVRSEAAALGGRVAVLSELGKGAHFTIHLPLTLAVTQVVILTTGGRTYAVPSVLVEQVQQLKVGPLASAYADGAVMWQGQRVPMYFLSALLGDTEIAPVAQHYSPLIIMKTGNDRVAIHVDHIQGNREVVVKNIGPQLARMTGIAGATVLGSGEIVLILNPVPLAQRAVARGALRSLPPVLHEIPTSAIEPVAPKAEPAHGLRTQNIIMIVDDSLTVRRVTQRLLSREGYQVVLAKDGVDALEQLQAITPDVMLVDIEMPRMDGFDLTRNVRSDDRTRHIPIIMITSRTATKHRNYAMELGVNEYLGKPYQEDDLLKSIAGFINKEVPVN